MRALRTRKPSAPLQAAERELAVRLRHAVGMKQTFSVHGVRYRELTTERLRHALSKQGPGFKDYDVTFASGAAMRIRATPERIFADLVGPRLLPVYRKSERILRPGMRVLIPEGGTGYTAEWVAAQVAPSGAVVSLDRDQHAVAYAQKRYAIPNISFELGGLEALAGETDGAFNAILAVAALREMENPAAAIAELWRVLAPAGSLLIACPTGDRETLPTETTALSITQQSLTDLIAAAISPPPNQQADARPAPAPTLQSAADEHTPWSAVIAHKPAQA